MSYPDENMPAPAAQHPVPVIIRNWEKPAPIRPTKTVLQTYALGGAVTQIQICTMEPSRTRVAVKPWTADIAVVAGAKPTNSPDSAVPNPPQGAFIKANDGVEPWSFFGCDEMWLNSLGGATFVTVIKEYL
jgi:hypothetical protein